MATLSFIILTTVIGTIHPCEFDSGQSVFIHGLNATADNQIMNENIGTIISQQIDNQCFVRLNSPPFTSKIIGQCHIRPLSVYHLPQDIKQAITSYNNISQILQEIEIGFNELIRNTDISAKEIYYKSIEYPDVAITYRSLPQFMYSQPMDKLVIVRGYYHDHSINDKIRDPNHSFLAFKVRDYSSKYQSVAINVIIFLFDHGRILFYVIDDHRGRMIVGNSMNNDDAAVFINKIRNLIRNKKIRVVTPDRKRGKWKNQLLARSDAKCMIQWDIILLFALFLTMIVISSLFSNIFVT